MDYNTEDIIKLLVKDHYLSPLNGEFLKKQKNVLEIRQIQTSVLRENLTISLKSSPLSPRNIRDFKSLLNAIQNVKDEYILSIDITDKHRKIFIDCSIQNTFDEI